MADRDTIVPVARPARSAITVPFHWTKPPHALWDLPDLTGNTSTNIVANTPSGSAPTAAQRLLTVHGSARPLRLIYGQQKVAGNLVFWGTLPNGNLLLVFDICEGPISGVIETEMDTHQLGSFGGVTQTIYTGTTSQGVDPLCASLNADWVSGRPGRAYSVMVVPPPDPNNPQFNPLSVTFVVQGRLVRTDPSNLSTRVYSTNAAWCIADYMTFRRGGNLSDSELDWAGSWQTAANDCDVSLGRPTAPVSAPTLTLGTQGNLANGIYYYTFTYFVNGIESLESPVSASISTGGLGNAVQMAGILVGPAGTTARNIYRTKAHGDTTQPRFQCGTIADNTTTTFVDIKNDLRLGNAAPRQNVRYTMNVSIENQMDAGSARELLRAQCMGFVVNNNGIWQLMIDRARSAASYSFTDDPASATRNVIAPPKLHLKLLEEVPTRVEGHFISAAKGYLDDFAYAESNGLAAGTDSKRVKKLELIGSDNFDQAQRIVTQVLNQGLCDKQIEVSVMMDGLQALPMDRVTIASVVENTSADYLLTQIQQNGNTWILKGDIYAAGTYSDVIQTQSPSASSGLIDAYAAPGDVPLASIGVNIAPSGQPGTDSWGLFWQASRIYSSALFGASSWAAGGSLANFTAAKVNDGYSNSKAFDAAPAADCWLTFDAGSGNTQQFGKVAISFVATPTTAKTWLVEYSDDASTWTAPTLDTPDNSAFSGSSYTLECADAGTHRYWRIRKGTAIAEVAANYSEVQFINFQTDPLLDHYEIFDARGATPRLFETVPATPLPTAANPVVVSSIVTGWPFSTYGYGVETLTVTIKAVRTNRKSSPGATFTKVAYAYAPYVPFVNYSTFVQDAGTGTAYWAKPANIFRSTSLPLLGSSYWTNGGFPSYDGTKVNDGSTAATAFSLNTASACTLTLDLGAGLGRVFGGVRIYQDTVRTGGPGSLGAASPLLTFWSSDDNVTYTQLLDPRDGASSTIVTFGLAGETDYQWTNSVAHRYWQIRLTVSSAVNTNVTEVQFLDTASGDSAIIDHYDIWDMQLATPALVASIPFSSTPTAAHPFNFNSLIHDTASEGVEYTIFCVSAVAGVGNSVPFQALSFSPAQFQSVRVSKIGTTSGARYTLPSADGTTGQVLRTNGAGITSWGSVGGGAGSILTSKGDVWGYSTTDARIPIGADGSILTADSSQVLGLAWKSLPPFKRLMPPTSGAVDGSNKVFVWEPFATNSETLFINGVALDTNDYSVTNTFTGEITLGTNTLAPVSGDQLRLSYLTTAAIVGGGGGGSTTTGPEASRPAA